MTAAILLLLLAGCGQSSYQKAQNNVTQSVQNLVLADDQLAIAKGAAGPHALADTQKLIYDMQHYKVSNSEQTAQIKEALLAVVGICAPCAQLLQDEEPS